MNIVLIITLLTIILILIWALFGKEEIKAEQAKTPEPDILLRRRASDREIEESFPDERKSYRRRSDMQELEKISAVDSDFNLPYSIDEIIPESSGFRIYRRTIANAEIYAKKGDFATAVSLYEGVNARINDLETNHKIDSNITYLRRYREHLTEKKKRQIAPESFGEKKPREIRLSLDGPLSIPDNIQIGITTPPQPPMSIDINNIAEEITRRLKEGKIIPSDDGQVLSTEEMAKKKELDRYVSDIERLEKKITDLEQRPVPESGKMPAVIEARYESPIPVIIDPKPIIDILDRIPSVRGNKTVDETEDHKTEFLKKEEDKTDEWDLLKNLDKDETAGAEKLSDEDIFAKILEVDKPDQDQKYEILGDKKGSREREYDIDDKEFELKQREEEKFYEKFLQHHKRKKRELPILKVSYDFTKLPDEFSLAREKNILEYSYYKYKPMLERANEFIRIRKVKDAINYYKVVMSQNIPPEFKGMIRKNIHDLTEYLEKYLSSD